VRTSASVDVVGRHTGDDDEVKPGNGARIDCANPTNTRSHIKITENDWDFCGTLGVACWVLRLSSSNLHAYNLQNVFEEP
jgi:hypothetical protein